MKETEIKLDDEGFEELTEEKAGKDNANASGNGGFGGSGGANETGGSGSGGSSGGSSGNKPDFRIVQADRDKNGAVIYKNVGGMWKSVSKNGNEFYSLRIGELKLLVFPNDKSR